MTNATIIFNERVKLMEAGILKPTGRTIELEDGTKLQEPEQIHTFAAWKELGYIVKKGEKSNIKLTIWKYAKDKKEQENEEESGRMFMKVAAFFTPEQVEKIS